MIDTGVRPDRITMNRVRIENQRCDVPKCPSVGVVYVKTTYARTRNTRATYLCAQHSRNFLTNLLAVWP